MIMPDPMEQYSKPVTIQKTKLAILYQLQPRTTKPGRALLVAYDKRFPLADYFKTDYIYAVKFQDKGVTAGNHYHVKKHEIFIALSGAFEVTLADHNTKETEKIILKENFALDIRPGIAHAVTSTAPNTILLVTATYPDEKEDEK